MTCYPVRDKKGDLTFVCGALGPPCRDCGDVGELLCDYPVGDGKTYDAPLCAAHATEVAPDVRYCAPHAAAWKAFREAGGVEQVLKNVVPFPGEAS